MLSLNNRRAAAWPLTYDIIRNLEVMKTGIRHGNAYAMVINAYAMQYQ